MYESDMLGMSHCSGTCAIMIPHRHGMSASVTEMARACAKCVPEHSGSPPLWTWGLGLGTLQGHDSGQSTRSNRFSDMKIQSMD